MIFGLGLGPTPVDLEWKGTELAFAWMTQQPPTYGPALDARDRMATVLGIEPAAISDGLPIQEISCGLPFLFVPLTVPCRRGPVRARRAGQRRDVQGGRAHVSRDLRLLPEPGDDEATVYSRMLGADREDPATGSASGPLGCYLVRHGLVPPGRAGQIVSRQGVKMGRPSRVHIRIAGTPENITDVKVGGGSVLVGDGRITKT